MWRNGSRSTVGGDVNWCRNLNFFRKLKIELRYDPAVPLLGIYPEKTIIQKDTFIPVFIAAISTIAVATSCVTRDSLSVILIVNDRGWVRTHL